MIQPPLWQRWLSYLFELSIDSANSDYNPELYVMLRRGRYQLCTANAIYSYEDLYDNFSDAFSQIDLDRLPGKKVLLLGFGLGSVPLMLEKKFHQSFSYTAVEIDEAVIQLASKYVLPRINSPLTFVAADAFAWIEQTKDTFDMICMDVFLDDVIPAKFQHQEFLYSLRQALNPNGLLLYNRLSMTMADLEGTENFYRKDFKSVFPNAVKLELRANWMLLNHGQLLKTTAS